MLQQSSYSDLIEQNEVLKTVTLILLGLLVLLVIRNWYNLYKKRSFRKKNRRITKELKVSKTKIESLKTQATLVETLQRQLIASQTENAQVKVELKRYKQKLNETLSQKEKEMAQQKEVINHQKEAYERYVVFKSVEANNTRLGAHFIKNLINQIYIDLESSQNEQKSFLGFYYSFKKPEIKIPSLKALKQIFKLLDYNVSALNKENSSLQEEWNHINMFMELIQYLKPQANIEIKNTLSERRIEQLKIKPTLFFPFVENALKHGSLNEKGSFIKLTLEETGQQQLRYSLTNSIEINNQMKTEHSDQFGLNALQQLLDAYYPNSKLVHKELSNRQYLSELILHIN
ncbi:hypothetical protein [Aequorivita xiaoshiensis]|uniref:Histidine kinase n=1 Tax=Aequorivita xiaoshiensis TaxID=2874476 RepID=A0A9X1R6F5_9FLAO|nr:hypothetical protein [Aequorivita xiaoshiensis]MCG2431844.1 hypothetical protein [Aequorivita xiaoshiensis]